LFDGRWGEKRKGFRSGCIGDTLTLKANLPHGVQSAWIFKLEVLGGIKLNGFIAKTFFNDVLRELLGRSCRSLGSRANNLGRGSGNGDCCSGHREVVGLMWSWF
jgi:hypothetical protein